MSIILKRSVLMFDVLALVLALAGCQPAYTELNDAVCVAK